MLFYNVGRARDSGTVQERNEHLRLVGLAPDVCCAIKGGVPGMLEGDMEEHVHQ